MADNVYIGETVDSLWVVTGASKKAYDSAQRRYKYEYTLTNKANGMTIEISGFQLKSVRKGTISVSRIIYRRIIEEKKNGKVHS